MNSSNKSATKVEAKRQRFRRWLQSLISEDTPGVSPAVSAALTKDQSYKASHVWYETSGLRDESRKRGHAIPRWHLPPVC